MPQRQCLRTGRLRKLALFLLAGLLVALSAAENAQAQNWATGKFLKQAMTRVTSNVGTANKLVGYGYNDGISILGAWVDAGDSISFHLPLDAGVNYMFLGSGDNDAEDVDLAILDNNGQIAASDTTTDADAVLGFTPQRTGQYTLRLTLYKARQNFPCVCVAVVLKRNGWNVPLRNLDTATDSLTGLLGNLDQQLGQKNNRKIDLRRARNQWALYGAVLRQGEESTVTNLNLGLGDRLFVGVGDRQATDIDLFLQDNNNRVLKEDVRLDATPWILHRANGGLNNIRIRNYRSNGPAVVLTAVTDIRE